MHVLKRDGRREPVQLDKITLRITHFCNDLTAVEPILVAQKVVSGLYDGVSTRQLDELAIQTAANMVTTHPQYDTLAARLAISNLHKETAGSFSGLMEQLHARKDARGGPAPSVADDFIATVRRHRERLDAAVDYQRDFLLDFLGFCTLKKSYLQRMAGKVVERPQEMWMRVAVGIHGDDIELALDTYDKMSRKQFTHATPTLFNAGTPKAQMSSCFLLHMHADSIDGIFKTLADCAKISKLAGGIGIHVHNIRASGSPIYGTSGASNGLVPMLRVFDATASYVDQGGGKRKGSFAIYLEPWHADIIEWLDLKKNTGKDEVRARSLFYGLWVPDLFMQRVKDDGDWTLMCPKKCPGLADCWGEAFVTLYTSYETEGRGEKTIKARDLWRKILELQIETSMPYIMYKDACNRKSNQQNLGTIKSSNLCTEVVEYTSPDEIAVCNLASVSLPAFVVGSERRNYDHAALHAVVKTMTVNLNRVIDRNYYPLPETRTSNMRHRPIGIGVQGLADVFMLLRLPWDSETAGRLNREIFETIYHAAVEASMEEAIAHGPYETFVGSPASQGRLQFDLWYEERKARGEHLEASDGTELYCTSARYDWAALKARVVKHGLRNSLLLAPMPTASTANILGNTEGFEPIPSNIYKRNVLSGEFIRINDYLIEDLIGRGLWNDAMKQKIIAAEGSIQHLTEIPREVRELYQTVWEIKQRHIIDMAADRGAFVCQSQSMNIYMKDANYKKLTSMHFYGWERGLKTGSYYIRQTAARQAQKFTIDVAVERQQATNATNAANALLAANAAANATAMAATAASGGTALYVKARSVLLEKGEVDLATIDGLPREDVIAMAQGVCSTDDPEGCVMCSG